MRKRWKSVLGSMATAFLLAAYVKYGRSETRVIQVRLQEPEIPGKLVLSDALPAFMHVKLSGPADLMEFPIDDLRIRLLNPGPEVGSNVYQTFLVPALPEGIDAEYKKDIIIYLDTSIERTLPVSPVLDPAPGVVVGHVRVNPASIKVEGPASKVNSMLDVPTRPLRLLAGDGLVTNRVLLGELPLRISLAANQSIEVEIKARVLPQNWKEKRGYIVFENLEVRCQQSVPGIALKEAPLVAVYVREDSALKERDLAPSILCPVFSRPDSDAIFPQSAAPDLLVGLGAREEDMEAVFAIEPFSLDATFKKEAVRKVKAGVIREAFGDHVIRPE